MNYQIQNHLDLGYLTERSTARVVALRAPKALWPITLAFSLFSLWAMANSGM